MATITEQTPTRGVGTPILIKLSSTNNPNDKNITFKSQYAFHYNIYTARGTFICQVLPQNNSAPYIATTDLTQFNVAYPTFLIVEVVDSGTWQVYNTVPRISVTGGDVFETKVIYKPPSTEWTEVLLDGAPTTVILHRDLQSLLLRASDLEILPSH